MAIKDKSLDTRHEELVRLLKEARKEARYYQQLSEEAGRRSVREIDQLSRINTELKLAEDKLQYRIDLNILINSISTRLLQLTYNDIDKGINWALAMIGDFYDVDRNYIFQFHDNGKKMDNTHEWCAEGIEPQIDNLQNLSVDDYPLFMDKLKRREPLYIQRVIDLEDEALRKHLQIQNIQSLICVPMYYTDTLIGIMGFDSVKAERIWNEEDSLMIQTTSDIFVNALQRKRIEEEQQKLEEQLQIRQRMDSLGTLAGGIAHDFNNILIAIMGNIDLLRMNTDNLAPNQLKYIETALQSTQRAATLIKEIQSLSKTTVPEKTSVDIYEVAEDVFDILRVTTDRLIEKVIAFKPYQFYVNANADQLHQVFLNLGTNSVSAIEEKGIKQGDFIRISAEDYTVIKNDITGLPEGEYVHISFEDSGLGMSDEVKRNAFHPLYTTRRGSHKGQGLGLAMVYNIITRYHEGHIDIETAEGNGAIFHIYLLKALRKEQTVSEESTETIGEKETVLIIEDEEAVRELMVEALQLYGYTVLSAVDGQEGLDVYTKLCDIIDIVVLDITMPKMSGNVVLEKIFEIQPDARVIISTGHNEEKFKDLTKAKGYLQKPYCLITLAETIRAVLNEKD